MTRRNTIACVVGRKGTGKSELLWERFTSRAPRVLSLDSTGETTERNPNAIVAVGWRRLLEVLDAAAECGKWHIAAAIEPEDVRELFARLTPPLGQGRSLSLAFGGMAVECGEVDLIAPNGGTPPEILSAFRRGRHYALDLYMATQRPASCAVDVRSMADIFVSFALTSPRDVAAASDELGGTMAERIVRLPRYHCLYSTRADGRVVELDAQRRIVADLNPLAGEGLA